MTRRQAFSPMPSRRRLQPLHAWLLGALLLAAQALGLAHLVAHAPGLPAAGLAVAAATATAAESSAPQRQAHAHFHSPHEAGSADCRLIDQLAHADALCASASLPPVLPRAAATGAAATPPAVSAGGAAAYLARGPPAGDSARIPARA